ncbi:hypothetical protein GCM10018962_02830 [Dactylosporangium matsuzakiense]|uniref:Uncharacterized protein n=1 Tax=Dactylosporangium matsuzakiense TaxID=53360 RepID=A0A9W6KGJ1_9ACTN|nr:hypothetical protein GCM10017581_020550 [Dactylosporangium matsuzakiense]
MPSRAHDACRAGEQREWLLGQAAAGPPVRQGRLSRRAGAVGVEAPAVTAGPASGQVWCGYLPDELLPDDELDEPPDEELPEEDDALAAGLESVFVVVEELVSLLVEVDSDFVSVFVEEPDLPLERESVR